MKDNICKVAVSATYRIVDGEPVLIDKVEKDIPADVIARFLIKKFGITPIFGGDND